MRLQVDRGLFLAVLFLLGLGLVQIYSSSFIFAIESFDDGLFFVKKQAIFVLAAMAVILVTAYLPQAFVEKLGLSLWALAVGGIIATLVPGFGVRVGGAVRWLNIGGGLRIEPSEFLKYTFPILIAYISTIKIPKDKPWSYAGYAALVILPMAILLKQPDFGSFAICALVIFSIYFARGLKWRYIAVGLATIFTAFYFLIVRSEYRMARVTAFLDPWSDPAQKGFQVIQSMLGFYSGGLTGVGLGQGQGKLFFLPEAHTDFTLSVLGEELGFVGVVAVLMIFGFVALRGLQISARAKSDKSQIIALGITLTFAITAIVNLGVAMGMLPTKGLGMPFLSYGGSSLIATCFGLGFLLNIERNSRVAEASRFKRI